MKKELAIIQILTAPEGGGAEFLGRELAKEMPNMNYESYVIYFSNKNKIKLNKGEILLGNFNPRDFRNYFLLRKNIYELKKIYKKIILHAHLTWPLYYTSLIKSSDSIKKIYTEHNTHNKRRNIPLLKYIEREIYKNFEFITCISNGTKINLEKWLGLKLNPKKSKVIYNGARTFKYSFKENNSNKLNIVSIGSLTYQKGFDISIRAVKICKDIVNEYKIYGEGNEKRKLEKLINDLGLNNIVKIHDFNNKLNLINLNSNLGIMPSRWEGFGLAALELLSAGIPILANSVDGLKEVINNCEAAILIENMNSELLAKEIYNYYSSFKNNKEISKKAIEHARKYSLEKMKKEYQKIYKLLELIDKD